MTAAARHAKPRTGVGFADKAMATLVVVALLDLAATRFGTFTGQPGGDTSYAVLAAAGTVAVWLLGVHHLGLPSRLTGFGWLCTVPALAALHVIAGAVAVAGPGRDAPLATVAVIGAALVCGLALLVLRGWES